MRPRRLVDMPLWWLVLVLLAFGVMSGFASGAIRAWISDDNRSGNDIIRDERRACLARGDDWAQHPGRPEDDYCLIRGGGR